MGLLSFIQNTLGGTEAVKTGASTEDLANATAEAGEEGGGFLEDAQDFAGDLWDAYNPVSVGQKAGEFLRGEVEGAGKLLGMGLNTAQEAAKAGQELGKAGQEGGKAGQELGKAGQELGKSGQRAADTGAAWGSSAVQIALIAGAAIVLIMLLRQPAGSTL